MPRSIRQEYAGAVYHVMCRGNNGQSVFEPARPAGGTESQVVAGKKGDGQRLFLSTLEEACEQAGWRVHAYVLMSNHYHVLLETPEANLVAGMKWFQGTYTQRFNAMFRCRGHLFQGRYKSLPVEGDAAYFRAVGNYIHLNPFRAGIAGLGLDRDLGSYRWSSYPGYIGRNRTVPKWLERSRLLSACGINPMDSKCGPAYRAALNGRMRGDMPETEEVVEKQLKRGWFIGGEAFRAWLSRQLPDRSDNLRGAQRRAHDETEAERLLGLALAILDFTEQQLLQLRFNRPEKQAVAWLLKTHTTVTSVWLADRLRMGNRSNVSRGLTAISREVDPARKMLKDKMTQCTG